MHVEFRTPCARRTSPLRTMLTRLWVFALFLFQVVSHCFTLRLGPAPGSLVFFVFFGVNIPTMMLAGTLPRQRPENFRLGRSFPIAMTVAVLTFLFCGGPNFKTVAGILTFFTAQALCLAVPVYFFSKAYDNA